MKYCPSCHSQYSDETLKFCLQDGTALSAAPAKQSSIDTVAFALPVTGQNFSPTRDYRHTEKESVRTRENIRVQAPGPRSSRKWIVAAAVMIPLLAAGAVGGAGWMYISSKKEHAKIDSAEKDAAPDETSAARSQSKPPAEIITTDDRQKDAAAPDNEAIKAEIADLVEKWKDLTEGHNADKLSQMYGEKVDYLGNAGTSVAEIRSALQKTFAAYSDIDIEISNLVVAVDAEGKSATAVFDEEWSFEAAPKLNEGKAHMKLHLQKLGNEWKIVTEKQLKVYFNEN